MSPAPNDLPPADWEPRPLPTAEVELPSELLDLLEELARHNHDAWARQRLDAGWRYGPRRDDARKEHPGLVPYERLSEAEKDVDRNTAREVLKAVLLKGYRIAPGSVVDRVTPAVRACATEHFVLRDDLARLETALEVGAPEAAIFYSARVLEALAAEALRRLRQEPSPTVFSNLLILEDLGRLSTAIRYWAHALRRLGNHVRHVQGRVGREEATLSALFAETWLEWFFRHSAGGGGPPCLTHDGQPLWRGLGAELSAVLHSLDSLERGGQVEVSPVVFRTPVTAAVLADILLAHSPKGDPAPLRVLERALEHFRQDLRLRQLMGLYLSREDRPAEALTWLEPLLAEFGEDEETVGIMAGACKKLWQQDPARGDDLQRSHQGYRKGWKESGRKNAWLGINAATTALWLKDKDQARRLATDVEALIRRREATLPPELSASWLYGGYWPWVTLAEAQLLQGQWDAARRTYADAFRHHAARARDIEVTRRQRDEILKALQLPPMDP
jgi:hypothetical protein